MIFLTVAWLKLDVKFLSWRCSISASGSTQATNRESIQKVISRLDEDLSTLGQISKLSETLSFPHQVLWTTTHADNSHMFYCISSPLSSSICLLDSNKLLHILRNFSMSSVLSCGKTSNFSGRFHLSVPRWGNKGSDGVGAQGAVREAVSGLQHDLPAHKAGVYHSLRREQLRLRVRLARHPFQLWTGLWRSQEEARSVNVSQWRWLGFIRPRVTSLKWSVNVSLCLAMNKDQWDPEFLKAIPIMKTRSGMQVRAASAV